MSVSIKPLEDRVVIQTVEAEQTTSFGLVLPDTAKEKPQEGKVVAVGPGRIDDNGKRVQVRRRRVPNPLRSRHPSCGYQVTFPACAARPGRGGLFCLRGSYLCTSEGKC